jgi:hypothetical protein
MGLSKPTLPSGTDLDFSTLMDGMDGGKVYIADGSYSDLAAIKTAFADQTAAATELSTSYIEMGKFQDKPFTFKSDVELKKAYDIIKQGKRTTTADYNLIGLMSGQKDWLESDLNKVDRTIVVVSDDLEKVVVVNGCKWACNWSGETDDWWKATIKTEFKGLTKNKIAVVNCPEA